jgi:hypothetical protein
MNEDYLNFYNTKLLAPLTELDEQRIKMLKNRIALVVIVALVILIHSLLVLVKAAHPLTILFTVVLFPTIAYFIYKKNFYKIDEIQDNLKDILIKEILEATLNPTGYKADLFIPYYDFLQSQLYTLQPDHYAGSHYMKGGKLATIASHIRAGFDISEKEQEKIFEGYFMICEEKFLFQGITLIVPDDTVLNLGILGQKLKETSFNGYKYVKMPNKDFNKTFAVYADNTANAYKIINDKIINTLLYVQQDLGIHIGMTITPTRIYASVEFPEGQFAFNHWKTLLQPEKYAPLYEATLIAVNQIKEIGMNSIKKEVKVY